MNPVDDVTRRLMAPVLTEFGFHRKGRTFLTHRPPAGWARVQARVDRVGHYQAEFFVDIQVEPGVYEEFVNRRGDRPKYCGWMWTGRLFVPDSPLLVPDQWSFDLGDIAAEFEFVDSLRAFVPRFLALLDPGAMLAHVRNPVSGLGSIVVRRDLAIALLLAEAGPSDELQRRLAELESTDPEDPLGAINHEAAAFIRKRLAGG